VIHTYRMQQLCALHLVRTLVTWQCRGKSNKRLSPRKGGWLEDPAVVRTRVHPGSNSVGGRRRYALEGGIGPGPCRGALTTTHKVQDDAGSVDTGESPCGE
jgi:hypothetical protein